MVEHASKFDLSQFSEYELAVFNRFQSDLVGDFIYCPILCDAQPQRDELISVLGNLLKVSAIDSTINSKVLARINELAIDLLLVPAYPSNIDQIRHAYTGDVLVYVPRDLNSHETLVRKLLSYGGKSEASNKSLNQVDELLKASFGEPGCQKVQLAFVLLSSVLILGDEGAAFSWVKASLGIKRFLAYWSLLSDDYQTHVRSVLCHYDKRFVEYFSES